MTGIDLVGAVFPVLVFLTAGFFYARRSSPTMKDFVLGGRKLSWWRAGMAMAASATNADSPLHQSGKIRRDGLTGGWFYWSQMLGQMFSAVVFSRLWRRSGITTVVEFYEIRYSGRARAVGRMCSMFSSAFIEGAFVMALGMVAVVKLSELFLGTSEPIRMFGLEMSPGLLIALGALALTAGYSLSSGLLGVVTADAMKFVLTVFSSYVLLFFVYRATGYAVGLRSGLQGLGLASRLEITPALGLTALTFFVFQPLATAAGTNSINQRYLSLRNEHQSTLAGIGRVMNHYLLRSWPWQFCGLCSLVLITGDAVSHEDAYLELIARYVPEGLRGLLFGSFVVAFMGTASRAMHNSGAVFVNDFYRPFLVKNASEQHYVSVIRAAMLAFGAAGALVALEYDHILTLLQLFNKVVSAAGILLLMRWFWWRVNGWADVAAQMSALPVALFYEHSNRLLSSEYDPVDQLAWHFGSGSADARFAVSFALTVLTTTLIWLLVMFATKPEPMPKLAAFYRQIRPYGFWGPVARNCNEVMITDRFSRDVRCYVLGTTSCGAFLLGGIQIFIGAWSVGLLSLIAAGAAYWVLILLLPKGAPDG